MSRAGLTCGWFGAPFLAAPWTGSQWLLPVASVLAVVAAGLLLCRAISRRGRAVAESEARYRALFENMNDAALLADAETGLILAANRRAEELLGRPREQIVGRQDVAGAHSLAAGRYSPNSNRSRARGFPGFSCRSFRPLLCHCIEPVLKCPAHR